MTARLGPIFSWYLPGGMLECNVHRSKLMQGTRRKEEHRPQQCMLLCSQNTGKEGCEHQKD